MASEVNGNYHGYVDQQQQQQQQQHNPYAQQQGYSQAPSATTTAATSANGSNPDIPKDEVGWYFVEQYYTTLSKSPEHLYLYYNKRSQFVSGDETAKVQVCVGQRAINDRIKELDFQDCKVRITNVDSQSSDTNIVIQVIGEISNKSQPHRKFTQTFVLGTQTNGYFVLNDIFRYIIEEEDEAEAQTTQQADTGAQEEEQTQQQTGSQAASGAVAASTTAAAASADKSNEPKTLTSSNKPAEIERDAKAVDQKIEQKIVAPVTNGIHAKDEPLPAAKADTSETPERPTEPEPTPSASPRKQAAQPSSSSAATASTAPAPAAPKSSAPRSWASLAASANKVATPAKAPVPAVPATQTKAADTKSVSTAAETAAPAALQAAPATSNATEGSQDEWTAVGGNHHHNRQQSRQVNGQQQQAEGPQRKAYIKNVSESVQSTDLKEVLEKFGKISHVDISRPKNCAFVDFETPEGYQAAVAANPHTVGLDTIFVEERKLRQGNAPFAPRGNFQQGGQRGGRGDARGGRGGFNQRGRGGQGPARGGARGGATQQS